MMLLAQFRGWQIIHHLIALNQVEMTNPVGPGNALKLVHDMFYFHRSDLRKLRRAGIL